jgi:hypothetical protein
MNVGSQNHSKRAIWLAVNSEYGDRLVEIAREHIRLFKELPPRSTTALSAVGVDPHADVREIIYARIEQLRAERHEIISRFEGVEVNDASGN